MTEREMILKQTEERLENENPIKIYRLLPKNLNEVSAENIEAIDQKKLSYKQAQKLNKERTDNLHWFPYYQIG